MSLDAILLALTREPASGYDLKQAFDQALRHFWAADASQIYRTLQRLEDAGQLRSREAAPQKGPARRMYRRTAAGKRQLLAWLRDGPHAGPDRFADVAQLVFMHELDDLGATLDFLKQMKAAFAQRQAVLRAIADHEPTQDPAAMSPADLHGWLGLTMGLGGVAEKIRWCDESIATVERRLTRKGSP